MTGWNDLPMELQEEILSYCLPPLDYTTFRNYVDRIPVSWRTYDAVPELIREQVETEVDRIEELFTISKAFSKALLPALRCQVREIDAHRGDLWNEMAELRERPEPAWLFVTDSGSLDGEYWPSRMPEKQEMLKEWDEYMERRGGWAYWLIGYFSDDD